MTECAEAEETDEKPKIKDILKSLTFVRKWMCAIFYIL